MATVNISNIEPSKTISDINHSSTLQNISKGTSIASNIALGVLMSAVAISPAISVLDLTHNSNSIVATNYPEVVTITHNLPFRISITNIGIEGYRQDNPPGIGVQVIGFSNYIL
jgi:hypothetical protein